MILIAREPGKLTDTTIALLAAEGVPRTQITAFQVGRGVTSTADEAHALRLYVSIRALYWPARAALLHLAR